MRVHTAYKLSLALTLSTWALLVFGAAVRVHGAGLACPDWPLCFGEVIPPLDFQVGLEFGHRVVAGVISLGFLALGGLLWRLRAAVPAAGPLWGAAAVVLMVQVVLGGLTVLELLAEWTVTSHLLAGNTFCLLLLLLTLTLRSADERAPVAPVAPAGVPLRAAAVALALLVPLQLALGGLVASSYAGLACATWPLCNGQALFPTFSGLVGLQVAHRLVAYLLLGAAGLTWALARRHPVLAAPARAVLAVVLLQAAVGVANVLLRLPVEVTLLHSFGAAATALSTGWLHHVLWRQPLPVSHAPVDAGALVEAK